MVCVFAQGSLRTLLFLSSTVETLSAFALLPPSSQHCFRHCLFHRRAASLITTTRYECGGDCVEGIYVCFTKGMHKLCTSISLVTSFHYSNTNIYNTHTHIHTHQHTPTTTHNHTQTRTHTQKCISPASCPSPCTHAGKQQQRKKQ